tara:strand:- start:894 stop:1139 length:246 start_codon:yes stop_codon:yes gene_type:complete
MRTSLWGHPPSHSAVLAEVATSTPAILLFLLRWLPAQFSKYQELPESAFGISGGAMLSVIIEQKAKVLLWGTMSLNFLFFQ